MFNPLVIFGAIKETFGFLRTLNDSTQRRERFELLLDKKANIALDAAQTIIRGAESFRDGGVSKKQFLYILKKHSPKFWAND